MKKIIISILVVYRYLFREVVIILVMDCDKGDI